MCKASVILHMFHTGLYPTHVIHMYFCTYTLKHLTRITCVAHLPMCIVWNADSSVISGGDS